MQYLAARSDHYLQPITLATAKSEPSPHSSLPSESEEEDECIMVYRGLENRPALPYHDFISLADMLNLCSNAKHCSFSVKATREEVRQTIRDLNRVRISEQNRFPINGYYIDITSSVCADLLDRIHNSLDFNERTMDGALSLNTHAEDRKSVV